MSVNQIFGYAFGAVYLLVGLVGFLVTGGVGLAAPDGALLLGIFEVNPVHNVVHLLIGAAFVAGAVGGTATARMVNTAVGAAYVAVGVFGVAVPAASPVNFLALNVADHVLHFGTGALALAVGLKADRGSLASSSAR
ncbi:MAG: DUF4383 domain-containing protein [Egibacteraceae bacterium]